ncbi:hypothetical protein Leryth_018587 [Lithospermum erythrorhizon]|nr:hypothetical protein Leryth_018587 [Lithospermum erythrorhizon]
MKESIKGISELCDEVICEEEKENEEYSEDVINEDHNKDCDDSVNVDNNGEEAVSVEKKGDSLVVHFNCPCGIDYEILLSGNNCYYRLT